MGMSGLTINTSIANSNFDATPKKELASPRMAGIKALQQYCPGSPSSNGGGGGNIGAFDDDSIMSLGLDGIQPNTRR